ncbi:MAG: hypothetical protein JW804_07340 [Sedimentisphaerales bacterium]|nr:hypothetical protein [Sedimentisphaerales bacterium]
MRSRDYIICLIAVVVALAGLIVAGSQLDSINKHRKQMNLVRNEPLENAPPSLAFATIALGAFRGLIVDILWIRAETLKEKGQFFDAKQIAEWIVTLQPRLTEVWEFHAWNMAYNISVALPASQPEQRWHWVKNGYELLRDRGIVYNPNDISLYRELARIFQHKIGDITDDAHLYYKLQLAKSMEPLLVAATEEYFRKLAESPKSLEKIKTDLNIVQFIKDLTATDNSFSEESRLVPQYLTLRNEPNKFKPETFRVIDKYRGTETLEKFDVFAKAYQLRNVWKLEPQFMQQMNQTYGPIDFKDPNHHLPLDWRLADSHAIYWAVKGLQAGSKEKFSIEETNTDRIVNHSLKNLYEHGRMYIYTQSLPKEWLQLRPDRRPQLEQSVFLRYDFRMFQPMDDSVKKTIEKYKEKDIGAYEGMRIGHRNFLKSAVEEFYLAGLKEQARKIYNEIRELYPSDDFKVDLVTFMRRRIREQLEALEITSTKAIINPLLSESYFLYALRDDDQAVNREQMAEEIYQIYTQQYKDEQHRLGLPSMDKLRYIALLDFLNSPFYPEEMRRSLAARIRIERPDLAERLLKEENLYFEEWEKQSSQP